MRATRRAPTLLAGFVALAAAAPATAQIDDVRWLPFIGCWTPVEQAEEAGLLCFRPADGGVAMVSYAGGVEVASEVLVADGQARPISAEGCDGSESVRFSQDGRRAFTSSDIVCGGDPRPGTGVMAMIAPNRWADVRALETQGERVSWVQEYRLVGRDRLADEGIEDPAAGMEGSIRSARVFAAREIDADDVSEALEVMDTEAVVAWIATQGDPFELDGDRIVAMADAGVPEPVIDVMVAVSYPDRFLVEAEQTVELPDDVRETRGRRIPIGVGYRGYLGWDPFYLGYSPWGYNGFGYGYGYGYGYGLGPYRYRPYGYGYGPTILRVERRPSGGRAVFGRGWTRRSSTAGQDRPTAQPRGGSSGQGSGSVGPSSGGSRPAARSGSGRTARRRGGG